MGVDHFGGNLRRLRRSRKLSQGALGRLAGVDRVTVARHEAGAMHPKLATVERYARALDVLQGELLLPPIPPLREAS